jgi:UDP-glucose 4-epimerase
MHDVSSRRRGSAQRRMRVLVTGGAGFIGSHVVDRLLRQGHEVRVVDDLSTGRRELVNRAARFHRCDIRSRRLPRLMATWRPDAVVHAAAQASVARSLADPDFDASVNITGTLALVRASGAAGVRALMYISTGGAAYGDTPVVPTPEEHPALPSSPYGVSKTAAERYVECYGPLLDMRTLVLRLANVYGPRQNPQGEAGVVAIFADRLLRGEACLINGDGEQTRDFVYVEDVAEAVLRGLERPEATGVVNIGTGVETTVNAIYARLARAAGVTLAATHGPAKPGEQRRSALAAARAARVLGWTPAIALDEGLDRTLQYFKTSGAGA